MLTNGDQDSGMTFAARLIFRRFAPHRNSTRLLNYVSEASSMCFPIKLQSKEVRSGMVAKTTNRAHSYIILGLYNYDRALSYHILVILPSHFSSMKEMLMLIVTSCMHDGSCAIDGLVRAFSRR